jgi:hypothetical protein
MEIENTPDVEHFIRVKQVMERHSYRWNTEYYNDVMASINGYLAKYCKHNQIQDWIDITPDESAMIVYCDKCYCTLIGK